MSYVCEFVFVWFESCLMHVSLGLSGLSHVLYVLQESELGASGLSHVLCIYVLQVRCS